MTRSAGPALGAAVVGASILLAGATPAAACSVGGGRWMPGSAGNVYMTVKPGEACPYTMRLYGAIYVSGLSITQKPRQGIAGRSGPTALAYRANPDARGADSFVAEAATEMRGVHDKVVLNFFITIE